MVVMRCAEKIPFRINPGTRSGGRPGEHSCLKEHRAAGGTGMLGVGGTRGHQPGLEPRA